MDAIVVKNYEEDLEWTRKEENKTCQSIIKLIVEFSKTEDAENATQRKDRSHSLTI